jgi:hypothetical protein
MPPIDDDELNLDNADRGDDYESPLQEAGKEEKADDDAGLPEKDEKAEDGEEGEELEGEAGEEEEKPRKRIRIPKERFDEAMSKARAREEALNQRIAELEQARQSNQKKVETSEIQTKIGDLQDKYEGLLVDGDREGAKKVRIELDKLRDALIEERTNTKTDAARRAAIEELKYDSALANLESRYPDINPDSDNFNEEKTEEVGMLLEAFVARGFTRTAALQKAVKYVLGEPKAEKSKAGEEEAEAIRERRATEARKKAADASKKQAPSTTKVGLDSDKAGAQNSAGVDILRISQEKFAELDEQTLAMLRGDDL